MHVTKWSNSIITHVTSCKNIQVVAHVFTHIETHTHTHTHTHIQTYTHRFTLSST